MDFKDPTNKEELKNKINSTIEEYKDLPNASVKPLNLFMGI